MRELYFKEVLFQNITKQWTLTILLQHRVYIVLVLVIFQFVELNML